MVLDVLALPAGVGGGAVGEYDFLVAAVAGPLQDLEGEVKLPGAVGVGGAGFALDLVVLPGEPGVSGLASVLLDVRSAVGEPFAQSYRGNVDVVLAGLPDDFLVGSIGFGEDSRYGGDVVGGEESDAACEVRRVSLRVVCVAAPLLVAEGRSGGLVWPIGSFASNR